MSFCHVISFIQEVPRSCCNMQLTHVSHLKVNCPQCRQSFCAACTQPSHIESCDEAELKRMDPAIRELMSKQNWKRCPVCRHLCERESGCNFMTCPSEQCTLTELHVPMWVPAFWCFLNVVSWTFPLRQRWNLLLLFVWGAASFFRSCSTLWRLWRSHWIARTLRFRLHEPTSAGHITSFATSSTATQRGSRWGGRLYSTEDYLQRPQDGVSKTFNLNPLKWPENGQKTKDIGIVQECPA